MVLRFVAMTVVLLAIVLGSASVIAGDGTPTPPPSVTVEPERIAIAPDLFARQIRDDVIVFTHEFPWAANSMLVVITDDAMVLVDTPYTPEATGTLVAWAREHFGQRDLVAINTGFHVDNLGGNAALIEQGIPVYGSDATVDLLAERGEKTRATLLGWLRGPANRRFYEAHAAIPYVPPDHVFSLEDGLELAFDGATVAVYFPGASHTRDNVVVYFPAQRVLFGGCMILAGDSAGNTADADMDAWPDSVRRLKQFECDVLVPGHGDRYDPGLLDHTLALLAEEADR